MNGIHGGIMMATGLVHVLFGLMPLVYGRDWLRFYQNSFSNVVTVENDRAMAAFWFVMTGPMFVIIGALIFSMESQGLPLPAVVGWMLLAVSLLGAVMSHKSGFTVLLLPQTIFYLFSALSL